MNDDKLVNAIAYSARSKAIGELSTITIFITLFISITSSMLFTNTTKTIATIQNSSCDTQDGSCNITVEYTVNNQVYTSSFNTQDKNIFDKTTIDIEYETNNPSTIHYNPASKSVVILIILFALLVFAGLGYYYYTIMTNKNFAVQQTLGKIIRY
jgi:flagellar basal body-associated protein FliL